MIRIVIADDHPVFRDGIVSVLDGEEGMIVAGEAENGHKVLEILRTTEADLVLMDVNMDGMDGMDATLAVRHQFPGVKVLMLTMHNDITYFQKALTLGVDGYILKNTGKVELIRAIKCVAQGIPYFSVEVKDAIIRAQTSREKREEKLHLTRREKDILRLICQEMTTPEIAEKLFISPSTVETHRKNLISKTGAKNAIGLVKFAYENDYMGEG